jgi:hypothetical protein
MIDPMLRRTAPHARALLVATAIVATAAAPSCSCDDGAETGAGGSGAGATTAPSTSTGTGEGGSGSSNGGGTPGVTIGAQTGAGGAEGCADQEAEATLINRPVDIVFVIDNSGSMSGEIEEVEQEISANFASIIESADPPIDYRVIMVSAHGEFDDQRICIPMPLGGAADADGDGHCDDIPNAPINGERFFHHHAGISSHDALCDLLEQYGEPDPFGLDPNGYQDRLRADAFKVIVVITDDRVATGGGDCPEMDDQNTPEGGEAVATTFDAALLALAPQHFGTAAERNYVFHSIIAVAPYDPGDLAQPHPPEGPIVTDECSPGAQNPGTGYQALSRLTGGLRYPTCGLDYTPIFQKIAEGVIEGSAVACEFTIPEPPSGEELDLDSVRVRYEPGGGGEAVDFERVDGPGSCTDDGFYLDEANGTIVLCPGACDAVQGDDGAQIRVVFDCASTPG